MKLMMEVTKPDSVDVTMTITMSLEAWKRLKGQLDESKMSQGYPMWDLRDQIRSLVGKVEKEFYPDEPKQPSA